MRLVLAATLSPLYGIYSGYELCERVPYGDGSEEYHDSEKYELKARDWDAPGHIGDLITRVNRIRREHPALQLATNLRFHPADDPHVLFYGKMTPEGSDVVFVAVNLDSFAAHAARVEIPVGELGLGPDQPYKLHEHLTDTWLEGRGSHFQVTLDPQVEPAAIYSLHRGT
jgi:starch synthase (maltosyl-transferring)